jgi:hypothetical protein
MSKIKASSEVGSASLLAKGDFCSAKAFLQGGQVEMEIGCSATGRVYR